MSLDDYKFVNQTPYDATPYGLGEDGLRDAASEHEHCWHAFRGPLMMVVPDGHVVETCCKCHKMRTIHADHR